MADDRNDLHGRAGDAASGSCYAVLNHLDRRSTPGADEAWVSGITYIPTRTGWSYLAVLIDLYSRKVVGWALQRRMPAGLVCVALCIVLAHRRSATGLFVHSYQRLSVDQ